MREFQHRHLIRALLYSKVTLLILALLFLLLARSVVELYKKQASVAEAKKEALSEQKDVEKSVAIAKSKLEFIRTDRGQEEYIRETFPVAKTGENVIVILNASSSPVTEIKKEDSLREKVREWWERVMGR